MTDKAHSLIMTCVVSASVFVGAQWLLIYASIRLPERQWTWPLLATDIAVSVPAFVFFVRAFCRLMESSRD